MSNPWEQTSDYKGVLNFFVVVFIFVGLAMLARSCSGLIGASKKGGTTDIYKHSSRPYYYKPIPAFSGKRYAGKNWGNDKTWRALGKYQMVAAMAILETRKKKDGSFCFSCSENIVHTIINRADLDKDKLPRHVSRKIYQPVIEPYQYKMLKSYVGTKEHKALSLIAYKRHTGRIKDKTNGATHYLVHSRVMVALQKKKPCKYWSWGPFKCNGKPGSNWTGYNHVTKRYKNQVLVDRDHAFLAPQGRHSVSKKF